jgi:hypothetical protein
MHNLYLPNVDLIGSLIVNCDLTGSYFSSIILIDVNFSSEQVEIIHAVPRIVQRSRKRAYFYIVLTSKMVATLIVKRKIKNSMSYIIFKISLL